MRLWLVATVLCLTGWGWGQTTVPATRPTTLPAGGKLPHLQVDVKHKQVRVDCEALNVQVPLEFFLCVNGSNDYESILRSQVRPSHLHLALLMIGLQPGEPIHFDETTQKWLPPKGSPVHILMEYEREGKLVREEAYRWLRSTKTKQEMPAMQWIFAGSRLLDDGQYAADTTGYLISVVNFDYTVIDIPRLASNANETLEWEYNPDRVPKQGTKVTMILEPGEKR